jgi:hypothetical protein
MKKYLSCIAVVLATLFVFCYSDPEDIISLADTGTSVTVLIQFEKNSDFAQVAERVEVTDLPDVLQGKTKKTEI